MSKAGLKFMRRGLKNLSQDWYDEGFVIIVGRDLDDLGKLSEQIVTSHGGWDD